ncbi:penicillin-binding protein 1C [Motilimonas cestriensis]|uniref:peptidoglycan glycosyltransferase n=1 Tax=Motilimonas cestriensis TaxID=2742685 RepID=A0ABS8W7C5_9GAMM|nr:penicillin-binding protein 1C [Motilimonas cestriensis]MCE2594894.1 penicillin-binding protein 1C [Motilimonas cestriensis]
MAIEAIKLKGALWRFTRFSALLCVSLFAFFYLLNKLFPFDYSVKGHVSTTIYTEQGQILRQFSNEQGVYRIAVDSHDVSPFYLKALMAYEDRYFYQHVGVNPLSLVRALYQHWHYGRVISGGSTLTMQVARMFYPHSRTYLGKLTQLFRALQLEWNLDKAQILNLYLTYTPMGGNIEGVQAASLRYFGKTADQLNLTESALLVVVPQRPSLYRPDRHPERALKARNKVIDRLLTFEVISEYQQKMMRQEPIKAGRISLPQSTPLLARELRQQAPVDANIKTYINQTLQADVDAVVARRLSRLSSQLSVAVMVMDNRQGHVLAYKGSADFYSAQRFGHVDMTKAVRSPGSTLKPFIYAMALDRGLVHSASLLTDVPRSFGDYSPTNFSHAFAGPMRLDMALRTSKNVPAVQVMEAITPDYFADQLTKQGIDLRVAKPNLAIALGGNGITLRELISLYSALARQGEMVKPVFRHGQGLTKAKQVQPLMSEGAAWIIADTLSKIPPPDRAKAAYGRRISWKTGTSYGFRDAWAIGVSGDYTVGVWIGRPDGAPHVGQTGANQAGPILFDTFDLLPADKTKITRPASVVKQQICWPSGLNSALVREENCLTKHKAWTINGLTPATLKQRGSGQALHQWPLAMQIWQQQTPFTAINSTQRAKVKIIFPRDKTSIFSYTKQRLLLKSNVAQAKWYLNDKYIEGDALDLDDLRRGSHKLTACDQSGCDSVAIAVY